jgi:hypothetical protein
LVPPIEALLDRENTQAIRTRKRLLGFSAIIVLVAIIATWRMMEVNEEESPFTEPQQPSVAVLPFANRSSNPDDAFFVDGIHDDLLTRISKTGGIKTISRGVRGLSEVWAAGAWLPARQVRRLPARALGGVQLQT